MDVPKTLPFYAITGKLVLKNKTPDGDTIRFVANNPQNYQRISGFKRLKLSRLDSSVQIRLDGIDAPEEHFEDLSQPLGATSRDMFLQLAGFSSVKLSKNRVTHSEPETISSTIIAKIIEGHGRLVAFIIPGDISLPDGKPVELNQEILQKTLNAAMVSFGYAYITLYSSIPALAQSYMQALARSAVDTSPLWTKDTTKSFKLSNLDDLLAPDGQLILPKLYRRCVYYLQAKQKGFKGNINAWLISTASHGQVGENDQLISGGRKMALSDAIEHNGHQITFTPDLFDLIFVDKFKRV